jgi:hypothetical protein
LAAVLFKTPIVCFEFNGHCDSGMRF